MAYSATAARGAIRFAIAPYLRLDSACKTVPTRAGNSLAALIPPITFCKNA
jgi:hypothetical protein